MLGPPLEVVLAAGLVAAPVGLVYGIFLPSMSCIYCVMTPLPVGCVIGGGVAV